MASYFWKSMIKKENSDDDGNTTQRNNSNNKMNKLSFRRNYCKQQSSLQRKRSSSKFKSFIKISNS